MKLTKEGKKAFGLIGIGTFFGGLFMKKSYSDSYQKQIKEMEELKRKNAALLEQLFIDTENTVKDIYQEDLED